MSPPAIPNAALDDRLAFVGTAGSGKTYTALASVERLLAQGARCVLIDPLDAMWGLRLMFDGSTPSPFPVVIFGGSHADLPITEHVGALIGETVAGMRESCIVSLSTIGTKAGERRFMLGFLTALYRHASGEPLHLIIDEADMFAPQVIRDRDGEAARLLGQMETIVRRGRIKGFRPWLITQRPAVLNKDVLSQADGLIALKLTASQDRSAIGAWIEGQADKADGKAILASLPTMQRGQGVVWLPGRGILETVSFPEKITFDSSRTPQRGETVSTRSLKPLDLGALKEKLASVEAETKANDPKALKAEIGRLKLELARIGQERPKSAEPDPEVIKAAETAAYLRGAVDGERLGIAQGQSIMLARAQTALNGLRVDGEPAKVEERPKPPQIREQKVTRPIAVAPSPPKANGSHLSLGLTAPMLRVLNALAWWRAFGIEQPTSEQVAFVAGYSASSSGYANLKGAMRSAGLVDYPQPGKMALTAAGAQHALAPDGPVTQEAFHAAVRAKLSNPQIRLLNPLIEIYPEALAKSDLAERSDYSPNSSGFANLCGQMRSLGFVDYPSPGAVRAEDWLFP